MTERKIIHRNEKNANYFILGTTIGEVSMHRSPSINATKVHSMSLLQKQIKLE
jgi:hypothetical protein